MNKCIRAIQGNARVRELLAAVAQNPQNESIDYAKTRESVLACTKTFSDVKEDTRDARQCLIWNLNDIFALVTEKERALPQYRPGDNDMYFTWIWENHTRLSKMIAVSMVLEGENLRSFGATPELTDIPQAPVRLQHVIWYYRESPRFKQQEAAYIDSMRENGPPEFYNMYTGADDGQ